MELEVSKLQAHPKPYEISRIDSMRAQKLLYVFARRYQMISACMTVSVRELRTAVREWACCLGPGIAGLNTMILPLRCPGSAV